MLLTLLEIRNRMLNCKPESKITVEFCEGDAVRLGWVWLGTDADYHEYHISVEIHQLSAGCRSFERQMHKAKRFMKYQAEK